MRPGDHGFLAAVLTPGKRATSVGVDAVSGTAGLIWPAIMSI
ncbi:MAG: RcpC/CpaB family pilus assembly protein [Rhodospirillales bacterium]